MVKLLILAYDFPPYISVGGLRPFSWYKFLHLYGVRPIVVTRQWGNHYGNHLDYVAPGYSPLVDKHETEIGTILHAPYKPSIANRILLNHGENKFRILRKVLTAFVEIFQFMLPIGSKRVIFKAADDYLKNNKVDCIIATGDPYVLFKYASDLSKKYSVPWIADYRDPWVQDKSMKSKLYKFFSSRFERKTIANASLITTASSFFKSQIESNIQGKQFEILYNGYDPEIAGAIADIEQGSDTLSIAFAGTIYDWHPLESVLRVCNELVQKKGSRLEIHFYGINRQDEVKRLLLEQFEPLQDFVHLHPKQSNLELVKSICRHNVCLLFNDYSIIGTKIFDYLAVKRRIILCYANDDEANSLKHQFFHVRESESNFKNAQAQVIAATGAGIVVENASHLVRVLSDLQAELREHGTITCDSSEVEEYSRLKQVQRLADLVSRIVSEHGASSK